MSVKIGFTGSRHGMTLSQEKRLREFLEAQNVEEFHHGKCLGSDENGAMIADDLLIWTVAHPPINKVWISKFVSDVELEPADYLPRDRAIVRATDLLVATPNSTVEYSGSGTWYTINYALQKGKTVKIIYPNGDTELKTKKVKKTKKLGEAHAG